MPTSAAIHTRRIPRAVPPSAGGQSLLGEQDQEGEQDDPQRAGRSPWVSFGCGRLNWPRCGRLNWPHLRPSGVGRLALLGASGGGGGGSGIQGGAVRADQARPRSRGAVDPGAGGASWGASPGGPAGVGVAGAAGEALAGEPAGAEAGRVSGARSTRGLRPIARRRASSVTRRKRIWRRLVDEHGAEVAETTVRHYVRARRRALGWPVGEVFVPQVHAPGVEAEVDWGQARGRCSAGARDEGASVRDARVVLGRGVLSGVAGRDPAGVPGAARRGVRVVRRRLRADPLRQPELGGQAGPQGPPARRDRPLRRAALALPVRVAVHARRASRARTRRAASRARSAASAATTSSRSRRSPTSPSSTRCCSRAARRTCARRIVGRARDGRRGVGERAAAAARAARRAVRRDRGRGAARRREVAGHGPPEPLLGPGRAGRAEGRARGSARARSRSATAAARSRATSGCTAASAPARSSITTSSCSQRKPGGLEHSLALAQERDRGAWPGCFDELWAALTEPLRALGGRAADGRRPVALPRARARPGRAGGPRRAGRRRARRPRRRGPRPPRRSTRSRRRRR